MTDVNNFNRIYREENLENKIQVYNINAIKNASLYTKISNKRTNKQTNKMSNLLMVNLIIFNTVSPIRVGTIINFL